MRSKRARWAVAVAIVGGALFTTAAPAFADPPGNNGTIKIDGQPFEIAPDNQPHVGCRFQVDFYGYDLGPTYTAQVQFAVHPPTGNQVILTDEVPIGEDSHAGGGSTAGLDAERTYDLTDELAAFTPTQQGFHVKLTIHADGSQGADVKHKVFWVTGCLPAGGGGVVEQPPVEQPPVVTPPPVEQPPVVAPPPVAAPPAVAPAAEEVPTAVLGETVERQPAVAQQAGAPAPAVLSTVATRPAAAAASLPRTGSGDILAELLVGLSLLGAGGASLRAGRRLERR
jgi:hypothetical protein